MIPKEAVQTARDYADALERDDPVAALRALQQSVNILLESEVVEAPVDSKS